ncbi:MAG: Gfo/Idh/MocA family oxidoreductase [Kofleriaceae bacterium]
MATPAGGRRSGGDLRDGPVAVAVIGAGYWGINHVRVLAELPGVALAAVCDLDEAARARAAEVAPGVALVAEVERVLADPAVEAVVLATPAVTHADLACAALAAGKHVLVEKPLALSVVDAERVVAAATAAGRVLLVGHLMVYHPALARLQALLAAGELGELHYLHSARVNLGRLRTDENALWSFGPHDLSMIDVLLDGAEPELVAAQGGAFLQPGVEDVVFVTLRYPGGVMAHVHLSWLHPHKERRLTLVGSRKMVEFDDVAADKLRVYDRGYDRPPAFTRWGQYLTLRHGDVSLPRLEMVEPLRAMLEHFAACCRGQATPRTDGDSGLRVVATLERAQAALDQVRRPG